MRLRELIDYAGLLTPSAAADVEITDVTDDSRAATPGSLFICRAGVGASDADRRRTYIKDAADRGAVAVVVDDGLLPVNSDPNIACVLAPRVDQALAGRIAEHFFDHPCRRLKVIAVTGTNGKTTTAFVIQHLLSSAGVRCGMIGTVFEDDGAARAAAPLTTPGAVELSRLMARMVSNGCAAVVAELSSHALHQGRAAAVDIDAAVFTNLTGDHLDYHATMAAYANAKAMLFEGLRDDAWAIVNADSEYAERMLRDCRARVVTCTASDASSPLAASRRADATCRADVLDLRADSTRVRLTGPWGSLEVSLPLIGRHNASNVLQAVAAATAIAPIDRTLREALETCPCVPGRLEKISDFGFAISDLPEVPASSDEIRNPQSQTRNLPTVLVDYAHTHDALENVLQALRPLTRGRLITLFGCGGDRDRTKRPKMAAAAARYSDVIIITSDNPRTEDPARIIADIVAGLPRGTVISDLGFGIPDMPETAVIAHTEARSHDTERSARQDQSEIRNPKSEIFVQPDRAAAIAYAIAIAQPDDVVLLAGKGHEDYQIIGRDKRHFDDREHAAVALRKRLTTETRSHGAEVLTAGVGG